MRFGSAADNRLVDRVCALDAASRDRLGGTPQWAQAVNDVRAAFEPAVPLGVGIAAVCGLALATFIAWCVLSILV
jgi:hypothetical protein